MERLIIAILLAIIAYQSHYLSNESEEHLMQLRELRLELENALYERDHCRLLWINKE